MNRLGVWRLAILLVCVFAAAPASAATKVVLGLPGGPRSHPAELVEIFRSQNPDLEVEELRSPWNDFYDKLPAMLATGTAPDVWYGEAGRALGWLHDGLVIDLSRFVERDLDLNDYFFLHAAQDPRTGAWAAIPSDFQVSALFYNTDHFASRGLAFPDEEWTTDDLVDAAQKLTVAGTEECPTQYGFNLQPDYITTGWMLWPKLLGGQILNEDRTESRLNAPATIDALEYMRSLIHELEITPVPGTCPGHRFGGGNMSMQLGIYVHIRSLSQGAVAYDVAFVPKGPGGKRLATAVPNVWVINAASTPEAQEAAWRWIKFQIGVEVQGNTLATGSGVVVNRTLSPDFLSIPGPPENRRVFLDSYAFADTLEENARWQEYRSAIQEELSPLWRGEISAQEAALNAHQRVTAILNELY